MLRHRRRKLRQVSRRQVTPRNRMQAENCGPCPAGLASAQHESSPLPQAIRPAKPVQEALQQRRKASAAVESARHLPPLPPRRHDPADSDGAPNPRVKPRAPRRRHPLRLAPCPPFRALRCPTPAARLPDCGSARTPVRFSPERRHPAVASRSARMHRSEPHAGRDAPHPAGRNRRHMALHPQQRHDQRLPHPNAPASPQLSLLQTTTRCG